MGWEALSYLYLGSQPLMEAKMVLLTIATQSEIFPREKRMSLKMGSLGNAA